MLQLQLGIPLYCTCTLYNEGLCNPTQRVAPSMCRLYARGSMTERQATLIQRACLVNADTLQWLDSVIFLRAQLSKRASHAILAHVLALHLLPHGRGNMLYIDVAPSQYTCRPLGRQCVLVVL